MVQVGWLLVDKRVVLVKHLPYALTAALQRLMEKERCERRPFVIVDHEGTGRFMQFCSSLSGEQLLFDVPQLGIYAEPCEDIQDGVVHADLLVSSVWSLDGDEQLTITEGENKDGPKKRLAKWWKKLKESLTTSSSRSPEPS
jgi:hypothetical protein